MKTRIYAAPAAKGLSAWRELVTRSKNASDVRGKDAV